MERNRQRWPSSVRSLLAGDRGKCSLSLAGRASPAIGRVVACRAPRPLCLARASGAVPDMGRDRAGAALGGTPRSGCQALDAFWAQGVGYLFTNVLPLRMGEPARVLVMAQRCRMPIMQVATTAVVERLLDTATIVLALIAVLPWMQVPVLVMRVGLACGGRSFARVCALTVRGAFPPHR